MMRNDMLNLLIGLSIASSALIMLILLLRLPLRRWFGADLAYQAWLLLPVAMLAMLLPHPHWRQPQAVPLLSMVGRGEATATMLSQTVYDWSPVVLLIWLGGVLASMSWFVLQHRWFLLGLGKLTAHDDIYLSEYAHIGPAMTGLWQARIIMPADFYQRYTGEEQALILRHEQIHQQRRDVCMNALFALAQCLFWFNPFIHVAGRCFRRDQELACDALVIMHDPAARRTYAEAMFKTQLNLQAGILACHWQSHHPLKERIMQLSQSYPSRARRMCAYVLLACFGAASSYSAWAYTQKTEAATIAGKQTELAGSYELKTIIKIDGKIFEPRIGAKSGEEAKIAIDGTSGNWEFDFVVTPPKDGKPAGAAMISVVVSRDGTVLAKPRLLVELDHDARMQKEEPTHKDDFDITLVASLLK